MDPTTSQLEAIDALIDKFGERHAMELLAKSSGFESCPPTIDEFLNDPYYLGESFVDDDGNSTIYPIWRKALREIYPNQFYSPYLEIVLTGSIGQGKSTIAKIGAVYDLCRVLHLKEPHSYFGVGRGKKIVFAFINATLSLGKSVFIDEIENWFSSSPYFREQMAMAPKSCLFPKNVDVVYGSRGSHVLGADVVSAVLSELNFQNKVSNQAYDNYTNTRRRIQSRFFGTYSKKGTYPGRLWLDSSKKDDTSFLDHHVETALADPLCRVYDYAIWDVHKHKGIYSGETFKVFVGSKARDPFIVTDDMQLGDDVSHVIHPPIEYLKDFQDDVFNALRDLAGKGTWSAYTFITSNEKISNGLSLSSPLSKEVVELDFYDTEERLIDYLNLSQVPSDKRPRFIHFDVGLKKDRTGIACTRLNGYAEVKRFNTLTGRFDITRDPLFVTEWVVAIKPKPGSEVPIYKLKNLIIDLRSAGVPVARVSADGYQSENLKQDLILAGIPAEIRSVDRTKEPYEMLKNALLEDRWKCAYHSILETELEDLVDTGKKIDHPITKKDSSKDIADACAGSIWSAFQGISTHDANYSVSDFIDTMETFEEPSNIYDRITKGGFL